MGSPAPRKAGGRPGFAGLSVLRTPASRGPFNPWLRQARKTRPVKRGRAYLPVKITPSENSRPVKSMRASA